MTEMQLFEGRRNRLAMAWACLSFGILGIAQAVFNAAHAQWEWATAVGCAAILDGGAAAYWFVTAKAVTTFDFVAHLARQREFSGRTFGPGTRAQGVVDHIRKELLEIEADPADLREWIDVVILALDGAWRSGANPQEIVAALVAKQEKNEGREWPDWRTADPTKAIEHVKADRVAQADLA
jgi:hypothetical protein